MVTTDPERTPGTASGAGANGGGREPLRARARVAVKATGIATTLLGLYAAWRGLRPAARRVGLERPLRALAFQGWARTSLRLLGVRLEVEGTPPRGPCLLVANHLGYLDIATLGARHPGAVFVSMAEVADWPVMGRIARDVDTVFVPRDRRHAVGEVARAIEAQLRAGRTVVLFPEGKSGDGTALRPFQTALLEPAARLGAPVAWAAIAYETPADAPPAAEAVCWTDDAPFHTHLLRMMRLPRVRARLVYGGAVLTETDRKRLARRLEEEVAALLAPRPAPSRARGRAPGG